MSSSDDFYIGYLDRAPATQARFLRPIVLGLPMLGAVVAIVLAVLQKTVDPGVFEFGVVRDFEGVVQATPYPLLLVSRPGDVGEALSRYYLVATGKRGADAEVAGREGQRVSLRGTLVYREGVTMVEVADGSVTPAVGDQGGQEFSLPVDLGIQTLRGEIVDSKCFLGVMRPGRGKPHRACATLCIRGGIPPVLRVETADGEHRHFLLTDREGRAVNDRVLDVVAEPVEITGRVRLDGDLLVLQADPATIRRIP